MATPGPRSQNRLLRELSRDDCRSLSPHLKHVPLSLDDVLVEPNKANNHAYFPLAGLISVHTRTNVTVAANALRFHNLIDYTRARIKIIDRKGLIKAACGCYDVNAVAEENVNR
jgi:hypothetical protein